ncbi:glutaredoxin family protein [Stenoxybacter acetivorans]|uniref:glutaredoxin family protein n=1 Tax=Stenoxybacter acetivorans TaxID=422441 RepID=UPI000564E5DE|nr:glutaredoxin family protein [Stenoxybacter acetivorans]
MTEHPLHFTLMSREYCSLCHKMLAALHVYQTQYQFELTVIDVDSDAQLEARYNELVPVLLLNDAEICHWYLDEKALLSALSGK